MAADLEMAKIAARTAMDNIRATEGMAIPGTYEYQQFMSARLMLELGRIRLVLETLEKD